MIFDNNSEAGIIATLIHHPEYILHSEYLKPKHFYNKENACIYWAVEELYKNGIDNIDTFNLTTQLNSNSGVKKTVEKFNIESIKDFVEMSQYVARNTLSEYKILVGNVITNSFKRDLNNRLKKLQGFCLDEKLDLNQLNSLIYDDLSKLSEEYIMSNEITTIGEIVDDLWNQILSRRGNDIYGIPSKFPILNDFFTYEPGELILFKARMKKGKSALLMNEALHKLKNGVPTVYFDTEMSDRLFFERMLANLTKIPIKKIKTGKYSATEEEKILDCIRWFKNQPFVHKYVPTPNFDEVYSMCKILQYKIDLQFVVWDYLKSNTRNGNEQYNELGANTDFLKNNIAGKLKLPVLTAIQLNRQNEVADSDKVERYVSVSAKWREKNENEILRDGKNCGNYAVEISLNRLGEQHSSEEYIDFYFDGNTMTIEQAEQHVLEELPL